MCWPPWPENVAMNSCVEPAAKKWSVGTRAPSTANQLAEPPRVPDGAHGARHQRAGTAGPSTSEAADGCRINSPSAVGPTSNAFDVPAVKAAAVVSVNAAGGGWISVVNTAGALVPAGD